MTEEDILLSVFVYGTLRRGERYHDRLCSGAVEIRDATTPGRLYDLPYGFPGLRVPDGNVRAVGTKDYASDARRQRLALPGDDPAPVAAGWSLVHGEVIAFDDPEHLGPLDALEGYTPGEQGFYERVLIPVVASGDGMLAWAYGIKREIGVHLPGGRWPA